MSKPTEYLSDHEDGIMYYPYYIVRDGKDIHQSRCRIPDWNYEVVCGLVHIDGLFAQSIEIDGMQVRTAMVCAPVAGVDDEFGNDVPSTEDYLKNEKNSEVIRKAIAAELKKGSAPAAGVLPAEEQKSS